MNYLNELNDKQYEAVLETEGFLRVIAGAGSGKTKLLVSRYVYLVHEYGIDPAFRNSGAQAFIRAIDELRVKEEENSIVESVENICNFSGYEKYIRELGDMERFENLTEFTRIAA